MRFLCCAAVLSVIIVIGGFMASILAYIFDDFKNFTLVALIAMSIIAGIWIIAFLRLLFNKRLIVTEDDISLFRGHKVKWRIQRDSILELIFYDTLKWYMFVLPIPGMIDAPELCVRLMNGKVSTNYRCYLSLKNARIIAENFGYTLKIIDSNNK